MLILLSIFMVLHPEFGFPTAGLALCLAMLVIGIRSLQYFFSMGRYMVDGRRSLYKGIIMLNLGLFTMTLNTVSVRIIVLYLIRIYAFAGGVDIMGALDAHKMESPSWRLKLLTGIGNLVIVVLCLYFGLIRGSEDSVVYIFSAGLFYSGIMRVIGAFRLSAIVYIQ